MTVNTDTNAYGLATIDVDSFDKGDIAVHIKQLSLKYGSNKVLHNINMKIPRRGVTSFIGPSGCGKSTLLRCLNRMNDLIDDCQIEGAIKVFGKNILRKRENVADLRQRVGMVFQRPNPFPKSIFENVVFGLRLKGISNHRILQEEAERSLRLAGLWNEVKDRLDDDALALSLGQQQRLVIARAIAVKPSILLLDEPTSALDPISTLTIEELINTLKAEFTIIIVTHNMQQAARVSDQTAFMYMGELIEYNDTNTLFTMPDKKATEDYITGRYG